MINPVWLRSFCTLAEVGHFTRTAQRLHMTQSGVSQHVRKLEELVGKALLVRQGKQFTLTEAGERLYVEAREIINSLSNLEQRVLEDPPYEGIVRVMSPGSIGSRLYPRLLDLQQQHPKLIIDYRFAPNADVEKSIAEHRADTGFMTIPSTLDDVSCKPVAEEPLFLLTPVDVEDPSWEILQQLGFIDHPDGAHHAGLLLRPNYPEFQHKRQFKQAGFSNQIGLILEPVSRGLGFTVLPAFAVEAFQKPRLIRAHRLSKPISEILYVCTNSTRAVANRVDTVIAEAKRWLKTEARSKGSE
tara:strand:- start:67479 stop:68378 length:900 start_codon:yes stop_codon:yes gene_type:complete